MNTEERDKFLTETMGLCWHESKQFIWGSAVWKECTKCKTKKKLKNNNFSTWEGFGKLYEWLIWSKYGDEFLNDYFLFPTHMNPDNFANAVYEYLKDKK